MLCFQILLFSIVQLVVSGTLFEGTWTKSGGYFIPLYESYSLKFSCKTPKCEQMELTHHFGPESEFGYSITWNLDSSVPTEQKIPSRYFPTNPFMGLRYDSGDMITFKVLKFTTYTLVVSEEKILRGSQGPYNLTVLHIFEISSSNQVSYSIRRSSREEPIIFQLQKKEKNNVKKFRYHRNSNNNENVLKEPMPKRTYTTNTGAEATLKNEKNPDFPTAYFIKIGYDENWVLNETVDEKILLISIAGFVNRENPNLYLLYPKNFTFALTHELFNFYETHTFNFVELKSIGEVLEKFSDILPKSYIVWDQEVRTSVITSFTAAAIPKNNSLIVSEKLIPLVEKYGIRTMKYDFRKMFRDKTDFEIYSWALSNLWVDGVTNTQFVTWLGGECHDQIVPSIGDFGLTRATFYSDLDTKVGSTEYPLANELMSRMKLPRVMGWHSYCKDLERDYTTLTSSHGGRVHGLNSFPNLSFGSKVPLSKGFTFQNSHSPDPGSPEKVVYVGLIQTDGIGMGAWNKPGRGSIPYTWEVTMDDVVIFPSLLEMFYRNLTKNDFLCAALSSPAYMYPKAAPLDDLKQVFEYSNTLFKELDLNVMAIMDYSEGSTVTGNTDINKEVVDLYFEKFTNGIGFTNGYSPSYTFALDESRKVPFLSYDYYLDPDVPSKDAVADLTELSKINSVRPYYLVIHVREWSDEQRVKQIIDDLGEGFKLIQVDSLIKLAGREFTPQVRYEHGK